MIDFWIEKHKCTGCGACLNICPENAIEMEMHKDGFSYPSIKNNCIECGKCRQICYDRLSNTDNCNWVSKVYAAWSKDENTRFLSTSGGVFSELAKIVLQRGGVVFGAGYQKDNTVKHMFAENEGELEKIRRSKYVQSEIRDVFRQVRIRLLKDQEVVFCGTPCQIAGLKSYLGRRYEGLVTVDFICRGVNSPKAFKAWLHEIELEKKSKITNVWFKYKETGWKKSPRCTRIDFENGESKIYDQKDNIFMGGYLGPNLYIRPSCGKCDFKGTARKSDITLADFWRIEQDLDDDKGTSMVIINSKNGEILFEKAKSQLYYVERSIEEIDKSNVCFNNSVKISDNSSAFFDDLNILKFSKAFEKNV